MVRSCSWRSGGCDSWQRFLKFIDEMVVGAPKDCACAGVRLARFGSVGRCRSEGAIWGRNGAGVPLRWLWRAPWPEVVEGQPHTSDGIRIDKSLFAPNRLGGGWTCELGRSCKAGT